MEGEIAVGFGSMSRLIEAELEGQLHDHIKEELKIKFGSLDHGYTIDGFIFSPYQGQGIMSRAFLKGYFNAC